MHFLPTIIPNLYVIDLEPHQDERGFFARSWCRREFSEQGINGEYVQCNISYNARRGTQRGLHYQVAPREEAKAVRVIRGSVHDVVLDLRPESPAFHRWFAVELSAENRRMLYVPEGCAHGYLTLTDDCELFYQMTAEYDPESARGVRWDDPLLDGAWPFEPQFISDRDRSYPNVEEVTS